METQPRRVYSHRHRHHRSLQLLKCLHICLKRSQRQDLLLCKGSQADHCLRHHNQLPTLRFVLYQDRLSLNLRHQFQLRLHHRRHHLLPLLPLKHPRRRCHLRLDLPHQEFLLRRQLASQQFPARCLWLDQAVSRCLRNRAVNHRLQEECHHHPVLVLPRPLAPIA